MYPRWFALCVSFVLMIGCLCGCLSSNNGLRIVPLDSLLVYQPAGPHPEDWHPPGLDYEDVYFETADGVRLHGWYCPVEEPRAVVLFAHGNAANITYRYPDLIRFTKDMHVSVFAFDYRGYGRSEGAPSEKGLLADARAARRWLAQRANIEEQEIVLFGRSLGGGVVVDLAARDGARALILESTFTSLPAVANDLLPLWPGLLMFNRFDSIKKIADYHGPLLIAHGTADPLIPFKHSQQLFAKANEPKQHIPITGVGHNWSPPRGYLEKLDAFFASLEPSSKTQDSVVPSWEGSQEPYPKEVLYPSPGLPSQKLPILPWK